MAINYVISYTFSPSTTISSSQVNTNFSDNSNTWNGLELGTKTIAQIKLDADPTTALQVPTKQYVDHYSNYRRPVLQYVSSTTVTIETGINGTSGSVSIQFPDGTLRTDATASHIVLDVTRVAALSGSAQSGLRTGTVSASWYAVYVVKTSDNSSNFVAVADVVAPIQANFATLNSNFGTNSWVYLGTIRYSDLANVTTSIPSFLQCGNRTWFTNAVTTSVSTPSFGIRYADTGGATSLTYTVTSGMSSTNIPNHFVFCMWRCQGASSAATKMTIADSGGSNVFMVIPNPTQANSAIVEVGATQGINLINTGAPSIAYDILLAGFVDGVLGVGSNPAI
jgi:hypothetical protein